MDSPSMKALHLSTIPDSHGMLSISGGIVPNELFACLLGCVVVGLSELSDTTSSQH